MSINPEKIKQKARLKIDDILTNTLPNCKEGILLNDLVRQIVLAFPVSPFMVKKFIEEYYIQQGIIFLESGILKSKEVKK